MFFVPYRSGTFSVGNSWSFFTTHKIRPGPIGTPLKMSQDEDRKPISITRKCRRSDTKFPGRLHDLLEYVENENLDHIVAWVRDGTAFQVHIQEEMQRLLSIFMGQKQYRSFTRQLKMWHFKGVVDGPFKGAFYHPYFQKNDKSLCNQMYQHQDEKSQIESRRSGANDDCEWTTVSLTTPQSYSPNTTPTDDNDLRTFLLPSHISPLDQLRTNPSNCNASWKTKMNTGIAPPCPDLSSSITVRTPAVFPEQATAEILNQFPSANPPDGCYTGDTYGSLDDMGEQNFVKEGSMMNTKSMTLQQSWPQLPAAGRYMQETAHHGEDQKPGPCSSSSQPTHFRQVSDAIGTLAYFPSSSFPPQCNHGHMDNVMFISSSWDGGVASASALPNPVRALHHSAMWEPNPLREFDAVDSNDNKNKNNNFNMMSHATLQQPDNFYHQGFSPEINDDEIDFLRCVFQQDNNQDKQQQQQQEES